jgi:hypothetical protein
MAKRFKKPTQRITADVLLSAADTRQHASSKPYPPILTQQP